MSLTRIARLAVCVLAASVTCSSAQDVAATSEASAPTTSPTRPILHFKAVGETALLAAVYADGREEKLGIAGTSATWAPGGDRFAYVSQEGELRITALKGEAKTILPPRVTWPTWSPDGKQLAVLAGQSLVVVDASTKKIVRRHALKKTIGFPYPFHPLYRFRWSPDGTKILVAFENAIVLDIKKNKVRVVADNPVAAEWAPNSNSVYYVDLQVDGPDTGDLRNIYLRSLDSDDPQLLMSREALAASRLVSQEFIPVLLRLSPDGTRLAVVTSSGGEGFEAARDRFKKASDKVLEENRSYLEGLTTRNPEQEEAARQTLAAVQQAADENYAELAKTLTTTARIHEVRNGIPRLQEPLSEFRTERVIVALDWAPDGTALVATTIPGGVKPGDRKGNPANVEVLYLADGKWRTVASTTLSTEQTTALAWFRAMSWTQ